MTNAWHALCLEGKKGEKKQKHGFAYFLLDYMRTDQVLIARMPQEQQRILNKVL